MYVPPNASETGIIYAVNNITNVLAPQFIFPGREVEDIKQEGWLYTLRALPKYKPYDDSGKAQPIEAFLYTVILSRYVNMWRDHWHKSCPVEITSGVMPEDEDKYNRWQERNALKKNILCPAALAEGIHTYNDNNEVTRNLEIKELEEKIDEQLDIGLRSSYLQMKSGVSVPYARRIAVTKAVKKIIQELA